ncbi:MAG: hypothetical protein ACPGLY_22675, partial [Rubripirellula sp.]
MPPDFREMPPPAAVVSCIASQLSWGQLSWGQALLGLLGLLGDRHCFADELGTGIAWVGGEMSWGQALLGLVGDRHCLGLDSKWMAANHDRDGRGIAGPATARFYRRAK